MIFFFKKTKKRVMCETTKKRKRVICETAKSRKGLKPITHVKIVRLHHVIITLRSK